MEYFPPDRSRHEATDIHVVEWPDDVLQRVLGGTEPAAPTALGRPLGTAKLLGKDDTAQLAFGLRRDDAAQLAFTSDSAAIWIGRSIHEPDRPIGFADDTHVCVVSGTRGGKGTSVIVPNLCLWPGSCVVIDPKGENATVTAARRGSGSRYSEPLKPKSEDQQKVHILDPFQAVRLPDISRASFNPLDLISLEGAEAVKAISVADRIASAIVVPGNNREPFWDAKAHRLIKAVILYVKKSSEFKNARNLVTVYRLLNHGAVELQEKLREDGRFNEYLKTNTAHRILWDSMCNKKGRDAVDDVIFAAGQEMRSIAEQTGSGILAHATDQLEFLSDPLMQQCLMRSDFALKDLKASKQGMTLYLSLTRDKMQSHFRWLRLMVDLIIAELERPDIQQGSGYPTLIVLDEFAGLHRMTTIENAAAQAAGFRVKFMFVVQTLAQLEEVYGKGWETFLSNSGLKIFFQIDDVFTRDYVSKLAGKSETLRRGFSDSTSEGTSTTRNEGETKTDGYTSTHGTGRSDTRGSSKAGTRTHTHGSWLAMNSSTSDGTTETDSSSTAYSKNESFGMSSSLSSNRSESFGRSNTKTDGSSWTPHVRELFTPDEIGRYFSRSSRPENAGSPADSPGLLLALIAGRPLVAYRVDYFVSSYFEGMFDPHPDHKTKPKTLAELKAAREAAALPRPVQPELARKLRSRWSLPPRLKVYGAVAILASVMLIVLFKALLWAPTDHEGRALADNPPITAPGGHAVPAGPIGSSSSPSFAAGAADRNAWETWFRSLNGDIRAGAESWASRRSLRHPGSCEPSYAAADVDRQLWIEGCRAAQERLAVPDARRKANPEYKHGWNSL
jgi:type IV secretory pathway TraG/TraD family ATPase VirD4